MSMQFTRNYDLLNLYSSGANYWDATKSVANNWRLRSVNGTYQNGSLTSGHQASKGFTPFQFPIGIGGGGFGSTNVVVGTSGTAFSYDDYKLTTFSTTDYSDYNVSFSVANDNSSITVTMYKTFLNSSGSEQTVREVGLIVYSYETLNGSGVLIAREVLATPIVVPANGYFKVPVTFTVNVPQNLIPSAE